MYKSLEDKLFTKDEIYSEGFCVIRDVGKNVRISLQGSRDDTSNTADIPHRSISALVTVNLACETPEEAIESLNELIYARKHLEAAGYKGSYLINDENYKYEFHPKLDQPKDLDTFLNALVRLNIPEGQPLPPQ